MKKIVKIGLRLAGTAVILMVAVFCFEYFPKDVFAFGIKIGGNNVGGLSKNEAEEKLEKTVKEFYQKKISFNFLSEEDIYSESIKIKDIGVNLNIKESLKEPFYIGKNKNLNSSEPSVLAPLRDKNLNSSEPSVLAEFIPHRNKVSGAGLRDKTFFENLKEKIGALQGKYNFPLMVEVSDESLDNFLTENFGQYETLPRNADIVFNDKSLNFEIKEPKEGSLFSREKVKKEIIKDGEYLKINDVYLSLEKTLPEIGIKEVEMAAGEAKKILEAGPYLIIINSKTFIIKDEILGHWFSFLPQKKEKDCSSKDCKTILEVYLDEGLVRNYLTDLGKYINIEPENPSLAFEKGELKIVSPGKSGEMLDVNKSSKKIREEILAKKNKIILSLNKVDPEITKKKLEQLQIETLIGKGVSNFWGSPKNRIHNIKIGTSKFNGVLIGPDEEFSFNKTLGEVGPAQGYLPELVIKEKKTVPEYGGGICQVSTTMFRVAVNSGMKILERRPHAYPVKYYSPQGFDATVYLPSPDLRFKNNTGSYILIQSKIEGHNLTFEFYGKDDGREVTVKGPYQYGFKKDGSMKARLEEEVWIQDKLILKDTFLSSYKSPKLYPVKKNPLE